MITHMVTQTEILGNASKNIQAKIDKLKEIIFTFGSVEQAYVQIVALKN